MMALTIPAWLNAAAKKKELSRNIATGAAGEFGPCPVRVIEKEAYKKER